MVTRIIRSLLLYEIRIAKNYKLSFKVHWLNAIYLVGGNFQATVYNSLTSSDLVTVGQQALNVWIEKLCSHSLIVDIFPTSVDLAQSF